jgi:hypothetical protein
MPLEGGPDTGEQPFEKLLLFGSEHGMLLLAYRSLFGRRRGVCLHRGIAALLLRRHPDGQRRCVNRAHIHTQISSESFAMFFAAFTATVFASNARDAEIMFTISVTMFTFGMAT